MFNWGENGSALASELFYTFRKLGGMFLKPTEESEEEWFPVDASMKID